ncbi:MAG: membrane protein insertase YidC [Alphaproteobacteria bacterium]|nr:membrane protein insertase YidC [Alphaproteobacteria bacterium]
MKEETKNLYVAIILSVLIIFGVNHFFAPQQKVAAPQKTEQVALPTQIEEQSVQTTPVEEILKQGERVSIETSDLDASILLKGARFDFATLKKYQQTLQPDSENVELLMPAGSETPYFAEFGFLSLDQNQKLPNAETVWQARSTKLTPQEPLILEWDNGEGLEFVRTITIDDHYLMHITDTVKNKTDKTVNLYPFGRIYRGFGEHYVPSRSVVHEGMSGVIDGTLKEFKFGDIKQNAPKSFETQSGWAGFSDRYWFSAFILDDNLNSTVQFERLGDKSYQVDYRKSPIAIAPQQTASTMTRFFAGAKEIKLLDYYTKHNNIKKFDLAVDFGWYYFLTKPFFYILDFLYKFIGNMGWAILLFAALLRLAMFPIANKSYDSMSKMRKIQPKVVALQAMYKNDKMLLQQKTMELYKREKINPAAGCLPVLIQIPIFFSLYKVLNIAIEIRHAPFIGWIKDLSAPDPLTISTWSHIPLPAFLDIGVWPILMGLTMWFQQKLNPAPTNKDQARMFALMPLILTLMLGHFASGLVIYWTLSNLLSIVQQKAIMYKNGVK